MTDKEKSKNEVQKEEKTEVVQKEEKIATQEQTQEQQTVEVTVTPDIAFNLKIQEFDKLIGMAKFKVAELEMQKLSFIYDSNLQVITAEHQQRLIKQQVEEELRSRVKK